MPQLCREWRKERGLESTPAEQLHFSQFYVWLQSNYPQCTRFRSRMGAREDIELWFDREFGLTWQR
jgi:hypothetical protein